MLLREIYLRSSILRIIKFENCGLVNMVTVMSESPSRACPSCHLHSCRACVQSCPGWLSQQVSRFKMPLPSPELCCLRDLVLCLLTALWGIEETMGVCHPQLQYVGQFQLEKKKFALRPCSSDCYQEVHTLLPSPKDPRAAGRQYAKPLQPACWPGFGFGSIAVHNEWLGAKQNAKGSSQGPVLRTSLWETGDPKENN